MSERMDIPWPFRGESEDRAHAKQPDFTTARSKNCRTQDAQTGQMRGGQRPGYSDFLSNPMAARVDAMASVIVDLPKVKFFGPDGTDPTVEWGLQVTGLREALALTTDRQGNVYALDEIGMFQRIGPDGEVSSTTSFYVPRLEGVVPRIQVDRSGNVYVATSHPNGFSGRVLKYERLDDGEDDEVYVQAWEYTGFFGIKDFRLGGGTLAVARYFSTQSQDAAPADLVMLGLLTSAEPVELYDAATPWPVSMIDMNPAGEVLGSCPANTERTQVLADEEWETPVESWSPHELEDVTGFGASTRLHFWIDAKTLSDTHVAGTNITIIPDRRFLQTSLDFEETVVIKESDGAHPGGGSLIYVPPADQAARPLVNANTAEPTGPPPRQLSQGDFELAGKEASHFVKFDPTAAGGEPGIRFLGAGPNQGVFPLKAGRLHTAGPSVGQKLDTAGGHVPKADGISRYNRSVVPVHPKAVFATFFVIRYTLLSEGSELVWSHVAADGVTYALYMNAPATGVYANGGGELTNSAGKLTLHIGRGGVPIAESELGDAGEELRSADFTVAKYENSQNVAIICIQNGGAKAEFPASADKMSAFRVNGHVAERFTMTESGAANAYPESDVFGGPSVQVTGTAGVPAPIGSYLTNAFFGRPWRGHLLEAITILGSTSTETDPNQDPVTWPGDPNSAAEPPARTDTDQWTAMANVPGYVAYGTDAVAYTNSASEIERMEGYLAHKWGCANVLEGDETAPTITGDFQDKHPFSDHGGGAQPPVGSPTAGAVALTDAGVALRSDKELVFKLDSSGKVAWAHEGGGHGLGVKAGPDGAVLAVGRHDDDAGETVVAKRMKDLGKTLRTTGDDTWELESAANLAVPAIPGLEVDDAKNLYWPREDEAASYLIRVTADVTTSGVDTFSTIGVDDVTGHGYNLVASLSFNSALNYTEVVVDGSASGRGASMANLAAAINNSGTPGVQYEINPTTNLDQPRNPNFIASVEEDGTDVWIRMTRYGPRGQARCSIPNATDYEFSEVPVDNVVTSATQGRSSEGKARSVQARKAEDGTLLWSRAVTSDQVDTKPLALALNPILPLYTDESGLEGTAEHVYVGQRTNVDVETGETVDNPTGDNVEKLRQVRRRQVIDGELSPRKAFYIGAAGGNIYALTKGRSPSAISSGSGAFQPDSPYVRLFPYRQKIYGLDGQSYIKYDPKAGKVEEWKAEGAGQIPFGAKLGVVWNGRVVLGRTADDPHNLHMSERGNPDGWDTAPLVITPLSAFSGASSGNHHFKLRDLVNCLIPARDDLLIIGGDQSVSRLTGDPGGQGQLDNITTGEGFAFGAPYAISPDGTIFVKGMQGGVWRLGVSGSADRISLGWIEKRLQSINLREYDVVMNWSFEHEGLHVYQVPKGVGERTVEHWFWDGKLAAWWTDEFSTTAVQPTCTATFDADDPDDRHLMIGCEDGMARFEDSAAVNDGTQRIVSEVLFGPFNLGKHDGRVAVSHLEVVLASQYQGCTVQLFSGDVADFDGGTEPQFEGFITPGFSGYTMARATGNHVWIKVLNGALDETWALETLSMRARRAGRRRRMG